MDPYLTVKRALEQQHISFTCIEHPVVHTVEESKVYNTDPDAHNTKSLFLRNKKKTTYYLIVLPGEKRLDMQAFKEIVSEKRLSMASEADLDAKLGLYPGAVTPFGILNTTDTNIHLYFDRELLTKEKLCVHPNTNEKTIILAHDDLFTFIETYGFDYQLITL